MFDRRGGFLTLEIGEGVRAALVADQQRVALGVVARAVRLRAHLDQAAVALFWPWPARDALGDDRATSCSCRCGSSSCRYRPAAVVRHGDGVELADGVVALQDAARVLPGDGGAGLDLGPGDLRAVARQRRAW